MHSQRSGLAKAFTTFSAFEWFLLRMNISITEDETTWKLISSASKRYRAIPGEQVDLYDADSREHSRATYSKCSRIFFWNDIASLTILEFTRGGNPTILSQSNRTY